MRRLPTIQAAQFVRFLQEQGCVTDQQRGKHVLPRNPVTKQMVSVPVHTGYDLGRGLALQILKQAGFTADDFLNWR
jgi:predicted RNA binding protein YcfA (HicA-like mRNA interferase family)